MSWFVSVNTNWRVVFLLSLFSIELRGHFCIYAQHAWISVHYIKNLTNIVWMTATDLGTLSMDCFCVLPVETTGTKSLFGMYGNFLNFYLAQGGNHRWTMSQVNPNKSWTYKPLYQLQLLLQQIKINNSCRVHSV